jgi:hypothetical protein
MQAMSESPAVYEQERLLVSLQCAANLIDRFI